MTIHWEAVERTLLGELQKYAERSEAIDFAVSEFMRQVEQAVGGEKDRDQLVRRQTELEREIERLTSAIAQGTPLSSVREALRSRERELKELKQTLMESKFKAPGLQREELACFAKERLTDVGNLLRANAASSKYEMAKHMDTV